MPPGYTACFMWVAAAILWWSGWRKETADGIPDTAVAVFLAGWPIAAWKSIPITEHVTVNGAFAWTALAMLALVWALQKTARWTALSSGILIGTLAIWLACVFLPRVLPADWALGTVTAVIVGSAAFLLAEGAAGHIAAVTLALLLHDAVSTLLSFPEGPVRIGSTGWMLNWWTAVFAARLWAFAAAFARRLGLNSWRREGEGS